MYYEEIKQSVSLTHIRLVSFLWDIGKQSRPDQTPQNGASDQGMRHLISASTVCLQNVQLKFK